LNVNFLFKNLRYLKYFYFFYKKKKGLWDEEALGEEKLAYFEEYKEKVKIRLK
jgi:hypothetical protein